MKKYGVIFIVMALFAGILSTQVVLAANAPIVNPLGAIDNVQLLLSKIISWFLGIIGVLALLAFLYGGFSYITSFGDDKKMGAAKQVIISAIIGLIIVTGSYVILKTVQTALGIQAAPALAP